MFLGIRVALKREEREDEDVFEKMEARGANQLFWTVALITIASGGDNLGIYIPYFTSLHLAETYGNPNHFCRFDSDSLLYQLQIVKDYFDIRNNREVSADDCLASFRWIRDLHYGGKWNHSDFSRMVKKFVQFI